MLPALRKRLKTISDSNKGLQDILQSMQKGTEILSVEPYNGKVHNTKITLLIDKGSNYPLQERYEKRVHLYNRVPLKKAIPANAVYPKTTVKDAIDALNLQHGCDFTEDDVEFINGALVAKETSLGYYGNTTATECTNVVNLNWYNETDIGSEFAYEFQDWVANLNPPLVKVGQKWNLSSDGKPGVLLRPSGFISDSFYHRDIKPWEAVPETGWTKIVNYEPEHFQFKFIYVFKDDGIYDDGNETWVDGFTKSGSFKKLLLGSHQTNNSVTVDSYPLEQLLTRYPELASEVVDAVEGSVYGQGFTERFSLYEPIPEQAALVIEVNILYCPNPNCNPTSLSMRRFKSTIPETHQNGALTIQVVQNGTTTTQVVRPSQVQLQDVAITIINMIRWFVNSQGVSIVDGGDGVGQFVYRSFSGIVGGRNIPGGLGLPGEPGLIPNNPNPNPNPNPITISIMKTQGESEATDIFEWLLEAEEELDAETLAKARSLGLSVRSCGAQYWEGV